MAHFWAIRSVAYYLSNSIVVTSLQYLISYIPDNCPATQEQPTLYDLRVNIDENGSFAIKFFENISKTVDTQHENNILDPVLYIWIVDYSGI